MISLSDEYQISKLLDIFDSEYSICNSYHLHNYLHLPIKLRHLSIAEQDDHVRHLKNSASGSCKPDLGSAFTAGLCEFLERYSLRFDKVPKNPISFQNLSLEKDYLTLDEVKTLQGLHPIQFGIQSMGLQPLKPESELTWVPAKKVISDKQIYIPQEFAVMRSNKFFEVTTSGCAIGRTPEAAQISGLYELFERHFIMLFWWKKVQPIYFDLPQILTQHLPHLKKAFGPWIKQIRLVTIPTGMGLPFFMAYFVGDNKKRQPTFILSGACHLNPISAIERCLCELGGMVNSKILDFANVIAKNSLPTNNFDSDIRSFQDHQSLYTRDFARDLIFFYHQLPSDAARVEDVYPLSQFGSEKAEFNELKSVIAAAGFDPFQIELTSQDVASLGLHVYRTFDLKTIDINSKHSCRRWGKKLLFDDKHKTILDLNPYPHPFP